MNIKKKYIIFGIILCIIVGYFISVFIPFSFWQPPTCDSTPISRSEYITNIIAVLGVIGTFSAVAVALFLDEIKSIFKKVKFEIHLSSDNIKEELDDTQGVSKKAKRYYNHLFVNNIGNINAQNCELYIESLEYINTTLINPISISIKNSPLRWEVEEKDRVYIPSQGKKILEFIEILAPEVQSTPEGVRTEIPPKLIIVGLPQKEEYIGGKWIASFCLYSVNAKPYKFKVTVDWDGSWQERQSEMKNIFSIKIDVK